MWIKKEREYGNADDKTQIWSCPVCRSPQYSFDVDMACVVDTSEPEKMLPRSSIQELLVQSQRMDTGAELRPLLSEEHEPHLQTTNMQRTLIHQVATFGEALLTGLSTMWDYVASSPNFLLLLIILPYLLLFCIGVLWFQPQTHKQHLREIILSAERDHRHNTATTLQWLNYDRS